MIEVADSASFDRPAAAVFAALTDFAAYPAWQEAVESSVLVDGPLRVGARVRTIRREMGWRGQVETTVAEFVPGELLTLATAAGTSPGVRQSYRLTSDGGGCRLGYQLALDGVPRLLEPAVRAQLRRQVRRMLLRLAEHTAAAVQPSGGVAGR